MFESFESWPEFLAIKADFEKHWEAMAAEAQALLDASGGLRPWHEPEIYEGDWEVYGLFWAGREVQRRTLAPMAKEVVSSWQPLVFNAGFSVMRPGVAIKPHMGYTADVLRLHVGLLAPVQDPSLVGLRVGSETRGWAPGKVELFDDTQEHEAWNKSGQPRVILLVDLLRPSGREKWRKT